MATIRLSEKWFAEGPGVPGLPIKVQEAKKVLRSSLEALSLEGMGRDELRRAIVSLPVAKDLDGGLRLEGSAIILVTRRKSFMVGALRKE